MMQRRATNGFTLVEVMVALAIFALIAASGVALLATGVRAQTATSARLDDVAQLRRMSVLLANDLAQAVPRTTRATDGLARRAFTGNATSQNGMIAAYVRGGWSNPDGAPRAAIQRVELRLVEGRLERHGFASADAGDASTVLVLADRVTGITARYRDTRGAWRAQWDDPLVASMPIAAEFTLARAVGAPLTLAFVVGVGAA